MGIVRPVIGADLVLEASILKVFSALPLILKYTTAAYASADASQNPIKLNDVNEQMDPAK